MKPGDIFYTLHDQYLLVGLDKDRDGRPIYVVRNIDETFIHSDCARYACYGPDDCVTKAQHYKYQQEVLRERRLSEIRFYERAIEELRKLL